MNLYQSLQLSPLELKNRVKEGTTKKTKNYYIMVLFLRSVLMLLFSVLFIFGSTNVFEQEQSSSAVVLLCLLLSLRAVDFGYNVKESIVGLDLVFTILLIVPQIVGYLSPVIAFMLHFASLVSIFYITSYD